MRYRLDTEKAESLLIYVRVLSLNRGSIDGPDDPTLRVAKLIAQPLILEVLVAAAEHLNPLDFVPADTNPAALQAAIDDLLAFGFVEPVTQNWNESPVLTARGHELVRLLLDLSTDRPADTTHKSQTFSGCRHGWNGHQPEPRKLGRPRMATRVTPPRAATD